MAEFDDYTQETTPNAADIIILKDETGVTKYMTREDFYKDPLIEDGAITEAMLEGKIVQSVASASTVIPDDGVRMVKITAQAAALTIGNPTETYTSEKQLLFRIKDNGTARDITWGSAYRGIGVTLPATTVAGKTMYVAGIANVEDNKMDILSVGRQA